MTSPNQKGTTARGYGAEHRKLRAKVKKLVDAGGAVCWRCGLPLTPGEPFDLGHDDTDRTVYRGPEHVHCNRATSGRKKRTHPPRRWVLGTPRHRLCEICGAGYKAQYTRQRTCGRACGAELKRRNAPPKAQVYQPPRGEQLSLIVCDVCGDVTLTKTCSVSCNRVRMRNRYRARVGIPIDAPLYTRAA